MLNVVFKSRFKKDLKKLKSSGRDEQDLLLVRTGSHAELFG